MCVHVKNLLWALYKNYLLFTIHFKVCIIELFWLVNFGNIIRAFLAYFKWDDMIYRSPNSIGSLFFNCPILRTATVKTRNIFKKPAWCTTLMFYPSAYWPTWYYTMQRSLKDFFAKNKKETVKRKHDSNSYDYSADLNNNVTNVSEPVQTPAKKPKWPKNFQDKWLGVYM